MPPDRFPDADARIPRFREVGDITLDLVHRDARVEACWLGLTMREFELLWRLADMPGKRLRQADLDGSMSHGSDALELAGLRGKLAQLGLAAVLREHPDGGVSLDAPPGPSAFALAAPVGA